LEDSEDRISITGDINIERGFHGHMGLQNMGFNRYIDVVVLARRYNKPDIFLVITCNSNWDEIKRELYQARHRNTVQISSLMSLGKS
jgi:hypothetical protein